jgi:hypothetical protein
VDRGVVNTIFYTIPEQQLMAICMYIIGHKIFHKFLWAYIWPDNVVALNVQCAIPSVSS